MNLYKKFIKKLYYNAFPETREKDLFLKQIESSIPHEGYAKWEYLKEHITEMRDADGKLNQKETCQFILNLMGVIEEEGEAE